MRLTKVEVLRETVKIVVAALSEKSVPVTQMGSQAFVQFDNRTGKPKRVNIPFIPDNASDKLIKAVQGFVDHECAHILFTDYRALKKAKAAGCEHIQNVIEDLYIERNMRELYRGSRHNLKEVWGFLATDVIGPRLDAAIESGEKKAIWANGLPISLHALGGNEAAEEFMATRWEHMEDLRKIIGDDLIDQLTEPENSDECLKLAVAIQNRINDWAEEEKRKHEEESRKGEPDPDGDPSPDGSDMSEAEEGDAFDEPMPTDDGAGEDDEPDEDDESEGGGGDDDESEEESEDDESEDDDYGMGDDDTTEEEDEDAEPDKGDGDESDEEKDEPESEPEAVEEEGEDAGGTPMSPEEVAEIMEAMKDIEDMEGDAGKLIESEMEDALKDADYWPITKDFDQIERYTPSYTDSDFVQRAQDNVHKHVGALQKHLERLIAAKSHSRHIPGFRTGKLHSAALYRVASGDDRVFRRKHEFKTKDVDVQLVVDLSGSMSGAKVRLALECAYGLAEALDRLNINCQVVGFTTTRNDPVRDADVGKVEHEAGRRVSRTEAIYMPIMKDWGQRFTADRKTATIMASKDVALLNNVDGECIEYAGLMLGKQPGARKLMIVLSDGEPCAAGDMRAQSFHLKRVVKRLEREGFEVFGIGIMDHSVERYYTHSEVVSDIEELPTKVMGRLEKMLLNRR